MARQGNDVRLVEWFNDEFAKIVSEPLFWLRSAQNLKNAADLISTEVETRWAASNTGQETPKMFDWVPLWQVYMLLAGLAYENLVKGIYLTQEKGIVTNGKIIDPLFTNHRTEKLIDQVNKLLEQQKQKPIELTEHESDLVRELQDAVVWLGRYPVPKKYKDGLIHRGSLDIHLRSGGVEADKAVFDALFSRLAAVLEALRGQT